MEDNIDYGEENEKEIGYEMMINRKQDGVREGEEGCGQARFEGV
jgi:hypothetical protein